MINQADRTRWERCAAVTLNPGRWEPTLLSKSTQDEYGGATVFSNECDHERKWQERVGAPSFLSMGRAELADFLPRGRLSFARRPAVLPFQVNNSPTHEIEK